jgi:hypothetical protein
MKPIFFLYKYYLKISANYYGVGNIVGLNVNIGGKGGRKGTRVPLRTLPSTERTHVASKLKDKFVFSGF